MGMRDRVNMGLPLPLQDTTNGGLYADQMSATSSTAVQRDFSHYLGLAELMAVQRVRDDLDRIDAEVAASDLSSHFSELEARLEDFLSEEDFSED